jgi:hypothetical protein
LAGSRSFMPDQEQLRKVHVEPEQKWRCVKCSIAFVE